VIKLYGISNCETVKKARAWLDAKRIRYEFVDFKKTAPSAAQVKQWIDVLGAENVVNRRGTTWRKLDPAMQARADTEAGAVTVLVEHPSAIKRPVIEAGNDLLIGFDAETYAGRLTG
jgi:arsenate reductase (glutaredoxin)